MPATDPDKNKPKPGHKHLNLTNVPTADLQAIAHAAITAGQNRVEFLREWLHLLAVQFRKLGRDARRFEFAVTGLTPSQTYKLWVDIVDAIEQAGGEVGGGYSDGDPNP
jgi:hypothetical protein